MDQWLSTVCGQVSDSVWGYATQNGVGVLTAQYKDVVAQCVDVVLRMEMW